MLEPVAAWAVDTRTRALDPEVAHHATRAVVDWVAATIAGARMGPATALRAALVADDDHGPAQLLPDARGVGLRTAALINAAASHTAEVDDIFRDGVYHPGAPTIAAALAAGQAHDVDGPHLLTAVTVGYEVSNRLAAAMQPSHYRFWHTTGTIGTIGAAAAAGTILGLGRDELIHALGNAATMAAGLQQAFRAEAMSKPLHAGHAADAGALAAMTAAAGFTGAADAIDGPAGLVAAMSDGTDLTGVFDDLGRRWTVTETTFKNHTCCGHTFAAIDAMLDLADEHALRPDEIDTIDVASYGAALAVAGNPDPRTPFEGKFSLPYTVAAALHLGSVRLAAFDQERLEDEELRATMHRVTLATDPDLDAAFPGQRGANVTVRTTDGRTLSAHRPTRRGDPELPLTDEELGAKFEELVAGELGDQAASDLLAQLWALPNADGVRTLLRG